MDYDSCYHFGRLGKVFIRHFRPVQVRTGIQGDDTRLYHVGIVLYRHGREGQPDGKAQRTVVYNLIILVLSIIS